MMTNKSLKILSTVFIILISTVLLLFTGFEGYANITNYKLITFWVITGLFLICSIVFIIKHNEVQLNSFISKSSWCQKFVLLYWAFTIISWFFSEHRVDSIVGMSRGEGLITISLYCISFLLISSINLEENYNRILTIFALSFIAFGIICIIQFMGYNPFNLYPTGYNYYDANVDYYGAYVGTIGNVDIASAFIAPASAMFCVAAFRCTKRIKYLCLVSALLGIFLVFKIYVKSGILGLIASLFLLLPFILRLKKNDRKKLCLILLIIIVIVLAIVFCFDLSSGMLHELHEIMHGNLNPNFGTGRIRIWSSVIKEMPGHLLFGYGPDTMLASDIDPWESYIEDYNLDYYAYIDTAHNEYLNVLYHQGIFACICFIASIVAVLYKSLKVGKQSDVAIILEAFILCYAIQAFFNISMCLSAPFFWIALGLLDNYSRIKK